VLNHAMSLLPRRSTLARTAPFAVFMALLIARAQAPADGAWGIEPQWLYAAGIVAVTALLLFFRRDYGELARQTLPDARETTLAIAAGLVVFMLWVQLDAPWMTIGEPSAPFKPIDASHIAIRFVGAVLLVPLMEELFWRSFLMRWLEQPVFEGVNPQRVGVRAVLLSTFVFTLAHTLWLAAAIAGVVYALLYIKTGKLWVAVIAHAVTNAALGVWVIATGSWQFW
jgi:uncharacterized protein